MGRINRLDKLCHLADPSLPSRRSRGPREQVRLVAEVPHPHAEVIFEPRHDGGKQQAFGLQRCRIAIWVAVALVDDLAAAHNLAARWRNITTEQPSWRPVRPAHMSGEERYIEAEALCRRNVRDNLKVSEAFRRYTVRGRLPVVPQQKDTHHGQA